MSASMILSVPDASAASAALLSGGGGAEAGDAAMFGAMIDAASATEAAPGQTTGLKALVERNTASLPNGAMSQPTLLIPEGEGQAGQLSIPEAGGDLPARPAVDLAVSSPALSRPEQPASPAHDGEGQQHAQAADTSILPPAEALQHSAPVATDTVLADATLPEVTTPPEDGAAAEASVAMPPPNPAQMHAASLAQAGYAPPMAAPQFVAQDQDGEIANSSSADEEVPNIQPNVLSHKNSAPSAAPMADSRTAVAADRTAAHAMPASESAAAQVPASTIDRADNGLPAPLLTQTMSPVTSRPTASPYPPQVQASAHAPVVHAQPGRIGADIGVEIARAVKGDREDLLIRLDPREMGRIDVRLSFDRDGVLRAVMSADSPAALDMLRRDSGDLNRALTEAGIRSDGQSLRFDARSGEGQGGQRWQQDRSGNARGSMNDGGGDAADPQYRPLRASGRVDLIA